MAIAKYDFEGMRAQASKVINEASELSNLIKTIDGVIADMKEAWDDPAQKKFEQEWLEMSKKIQGYVPIIEDYGKAVNNHADKIEHAGTGI